MSSDLRFDGRVAIITGAGGGLGRAHALLLGSRGAKVVVNDLGGGIHGGGASQTPAQKVVDEIKALGGEAVANYNSVEDGDKIVQTAVDAFGRVDIVINNAGILRDVSFHKMTTEDWDLIYRVHLKGAYAVTRAAWPYLRGNEFGRVIVTSSGAGIYGNFGQANYSACKLALYGFIRTLALEGGGRNIHCNAIAPLAGSRMTETVLPPPLIEVLKPEYVSPLVAWLSHDACKENGGLFEVGAGWFAKLRWERTKGFSIPAGDPVTLEKVADNWSKVVDWTNADHPQSTQEAFAPIMANLNKKAEPKRGNANVDLDKVVGFQFKPTTTEHTRRDSIVYALGVGVAKDPADKEDLKYVYELNSGGFFALPTMAVTFPQSMLMELVSVPGLKFNPAMVLHGEQYLELRAPVPTEGKLTSTGKISNVYDKGKGALVVLDAVTKDASGREIAFNQFSAFIRGIGDFGGDRGPGGPMNEAPDRAPDATEEFKTTDNQALLYRLSGDTNPLHADPAIAAIGGFSKPILHGLCTFGVAGRAILKHFCKNDPNKLKSLRVRFAKHVFPGETVVTEMWRESDSRIIFRCKVKERGEIILSNAAAEIHEGFPKPQAAAAGDSAASAKSDGGGVASVFAKIADRIKGDPSVVEKIGAVYQFNITGERGSAYTVDLKNGSGGVKPGEGDKPDCAVTMDHDDFMSIMAGKLDPQAAFMQGKLKVGGNMMLAAKLGAILK